MGELQKTGHDMHDVARAASGIRALLGRRSSVIVGIDGFGGAGKSSLARLIEAQIGEGVIVGLDDFMFPERLMDSTWERVWDRARIVAEVIEPFRLGAAPRHDRRDDDGSQPARLLLLEGLTVFHPDLVDLLDYRVWVDTPLEVAMKRGLERDIAGGTEGWPWSPEEAWRQWASNDADYLARYAPVARADVIVSNS